MHSPHLLRVTAVECCPTSVRITHLFRASLAAPRIAGRALRQAHEGARADASSYLIARARRRQGRGAARSQDGAQPGGCLLVSVNHRPSRAGARRRGRYHSRHRAARAARSAPSEGLAELPMAPPAPHDREAGDDHHCGCRMHGECHSSRARGPSRAMRVAHLAADAFEIPPADRDADALARLGVRRQFVPTVGSVDRRKHLEFLR